MTDTTQELDYTHPDEKPTVEHKPNPYSDLRGMIVHFTSEMLDNPNDYGIYPTTNFYNDLEEAILDWHNKQIEVIIEATYDNLPSLDKLTVGNEMSDGYDQGVEAFRQAIEAERNKLKESTDE